MIGGFEGVSDLVGASDLVFTVGTQPFEAGSLMCLNVTIIDDHLIEGEESFAVCGFSEQSGVVILEGGCTDVFIEDNDAGIELCSAYKNCFFVFIMKYSLVFIFPPSPNGIYTVEVQRSLTVACSSSNFGDIVSWIRKFTRIILL